MLSRCTSPTKREFPDYGGRGITVCVRWMEFPNFLADMGERPAGMTLDRIDNDKGYEPGNCRWATPKEQSRNTRANRMVEAFGRTQCLAAWAEECGLKWWTLYARLFVYRWPVEDALTRPVKGAA